MQTESVSSTPTPTLRQRTLARQLRELREQRGLTLEQAADHIGISRATMSRIETCRVLMRARDVMALTDLYQAEPDLREALIDMARNVSQRRWWAPYSSVLPAAFSVYLTLERDAGRISTFELELIPGLLQTREYARAVINTEPKLSPDEVDQRVHVRMERQKQHPAHLHVILGEAAIHRVVGSPEAMATQLEHLITMSQGNWLTLQVLPFSVGAHPGMGSSFTVLEFGGQGQEPALYCDTASGGLYVEGAQAQQHLTAFATLHLQALDTKKTCMLLAERAAMFRKINGESKEKHGD